MTVDFKFKLDDEVYAVFKENGEVHILKDKITEVVISEKNGKHYYLENIGDEFKEDELILAEKHHLLSAKIKQLFEVNEDD